MFVSEIIGGFIAGEVVAVEDGISGAHCGGEASQFGLVTGDHGRISVFREDVRGILSVDFGCECFVGGRGDDWEAQPGADVPEAFGPWTCPIGVPELVCPCDECWAGEVISSVGVDMVVLDFV